jgi:putative transposase
MPRAMRVEYPGAIYHVMDRGDRREDIFVDDVDRQDTTDGSAATGGSG